MTVREYEFIKSHQVGDIFYFICPACLDVMQKLNNAGALTCACGQKLIRTNTVKYRAANTPAPRT